jgi:hypothetical protein
MPEIHPSDSGYRFPSPFSLLKPLLLSNILRNNYLSFLKTQMRIDNSHIHFIINTNNLSPRNDIYCYTDSLQHR